MFHKGEVLRIKIFFVFILLSLRVFANKEDILNGMSITTIPAERANEEQTTFNPTTYYDGPITIHGSGYYSIEGNFTADSNITDPALFIGSTIYPITIYIDSTRVYQWGDGDKSNHFADYRSHSVTLPTEIKGKHHLRIDFWSNGESFNLPTITITDRSKAQYKAMVNSFFNIHLLNGILLTALFAAILFLAYFVISGMNELEILFFSLFSITIIISLIIFPLNSQMFNEVTLFKIARIGTLFLPFFLIQFVRTYTISWDKNRVLFWVPLAFTIYYSIQIIMSHNGKVGINYVLDHGGFNLILIEFVITLILLAKSFFRTQRGEVALIFIGFLAFIMMAGHDIWFLSHKLLPQCWLVSYGYFILLLSMISALILRQRAAYTKLLYYKLELMDANKKIAIESENREKLILTLAHELKTPIHGLNGGICELKEKLEKKNELEILKTTNILPSFEYLKNTLANIFAFVDVEHDSLHISNYSFNLKDTVTELSEIFIQQSEDKGVTLKLNFDNSIPYDYIISDKKHLKLVLVNIISNAVKYTNEGLISVNVSNNENSIMFKIIDTGIGIDYDSIQNIFRAFTNNDNTFSKKYEGVGLGLSISSSIIKKMKGSIDIDSTVGVGTKVTVSIPVIFDKTKLKVLDLSGFSLLVVDDNRTNYRLLKRALLKLGANVSIATNGKQAIELHQQYQYDLILMDIQMPIMNGLEATQKIRLFDNKTPIIAVTANGDYATCINAGMNDHINKPIDFNHLNNILEKNLVNA